MKEIIKITFSIMETNEDNNFYDNLVAFYTGIVENISQNIHNEIVNLLNDMKKNSLLLRIYKLIKSKSNI
jgi:hypothetical protein